MQSKFNNNELKLVIVDTCFNLVGDAQCVYCQCVDIYKFVCIYTYFNIPSTQNSLPHSTSHRRAEMHTCDNQTLI